jgi:small subunit ribosomal protein S5
MRKRETRPPQRTNRRRMDNVPEPEVVWKPVTELGRKVKEGTVTDIEEVFSLGENILEAEIVNTLLPSLEEDLLLIGQAKGKFGGGQRRIFRQTQKKTREGNKIQFMTCALVGNKNGYVGIATGKSKETVPARDKSKRKARLNLIRIRRGCGSWECNCREPHSIPFAIEGNCGSSRIKLMPAPKGKGLCVEKECAKILEMAGIKDIWSKTSGQTKTKLNLISALIDALKKLNQVKIKPDQIQQLGIIDGKMKGDEAIIEPIPESLEVDEINGSGEASSGITNESESSEQKKEETKEEVKEVKEGVVEDISTNDNIAVVEE